MMSKSIVLSERLRPRAIELMKDMYVAHAADPNCPWAKDGRGTECPKMVELKQRIEEEEKLLGVGNFSR